MCSVGNVFETYSKYFWGHFQKFDCILLITFSISLKKAEVLDQKYPLQVENSEFLDKKNGNWVNLGITESSGSPDIGITQFHCSFFSQLCRNNGVQAFLCYSSLVWESFCSEQVMS